MSKRKGFALLGVLIVIVVIGLVGGIGYVRNIIGLTRCDFQAPYKAEVIRAVGVVVPPVGAIVGWIGVEDVSETK